MLRVASNFLTFLWLFIRTASQPYSLTVLQPFAFGLRASPALEQFQLFAIGLRRAIVDALELALEMGGGVVTAEADDLGDGLVGLRQQPAGVGYAQPVDVLRHGAAGAFFEEAAEGAFAETGLARQIRHPQGLCQVLRDVFTGRADAVG